MATYIIDRDYILKVNENQRKALALAIYIKNVKPASIIKDWTYRRIADLTKLSPTTCKKYIKELKRMHLVKTFHQDGHAYIKFLPLRHKAVADSHGNLRKYRGFNTNIERIDFSSVKNIVMGLKAMVIVEVQKRKDYYTQLSNSKDSKTVKKILKKLKKSGRGVDTISDKGFSYNGIRRKIHCGLNMVSRIISYGERNDMFVKETSEPVQIFVGTGRGLHASSVLPCSYHTRSNLYIQSSNRFFLPCYSITLPKMDTIVL